MLITTIEELRLAFPAHAIDDISPLTGVLENSEHDFLQEKLGTPLYNKICAYYEDNHRTDSIIETEQTGYYNRLVLLCQRVIVYDTFARAIGLNIISPNNAGVNIPTADDYGKVDLEAVRTFQKTCNREAHAALNRLLQALEEWCQQASLTATPSSSSGTATSSSSSVAGDAIAATDPELAEITSLWRHSRYYYLAASLFIPSSTVLQDYWNTYDSREKFIQMLPDLRYIQEEVIAPSIGEEFTEALVAINRDTVTHRATASSSVAGDAISAPTPSSSSVAGDATAAAPNLLPFKTIEKLRKAMAAMLEERTLVIATDKLRRAQAHDEAVRLLQSAITFIKNHQEDYNTPAPTPSSSSSVAGDTIAAPAQPTALYAALMLSPLYDPSKAAATSAATSSVAGDVIAASNTGSSTPPPHHSDRHFENNRRDSALFVTPFLN